VAKLNFINLAILGKGSPADALTIFVEYQDRVLQYPHSMLRTDEKAWNGFHSAGSTSIGPWLQAGSHNDMITQQPRSGQSG
jgi:hypothetical protein